MFATIRRLLIEEEGASLAEYALLLGLITVAIVSVLSFFKESIATIFTRTTNTLNSSS